MSILCGTILRESIRSGEFLSYIPRGVGALGLRLTTSSHREPLVKRDPNTHTPPTTCIWDKNSPNYVSCRIGFSTLYPSIWGQTSRSTTSGPGGNAHFSAVRTPNRMGFAHAYAQVTLEARRTTYYGRRWGGTHNGTKSGENKYCPVVSSHKVNSFWNLPICMTFSCRNVPYL
jgi:hypothetical protein